MVHGNSKRGRMNARVCVCAGALCFPQGGGHLWVYLNWALGLRALGCQVFWLEGVWPGIDNALVAALKSRLGRYGLAEYLALFSWTGAPLHDGAENECLHVAAAADADLLL